MELTEKQKQTVTAGVVLTLALLFIIGYFYFMSVKPHIAKSKTEIAKVETNIKNMKSDINMMKQFARNEEEIEELRKQVDQARLRLPSDPEAIQFLQVLQDSLRKTGVGFTNVSKGKLIDRSLYNEIPYTVKGSARYHELGQFINLIECNPDRFLRVNKLTIANDYKRPSVHPMEVGISTFMFKSS